MIIHHATISSFLFFSLSLINYGFVFSQARLNINNSLIATASEGDGQVPFSINIWSIY